MGCLRPFLAKSNNRKILSWLGGGVVVAIGGLWVTYLDFFPAKDGARDEREREDHDRRGAPGHGADEPRIAALDAAIGPVEAAREEVALLGRCPR